jgi:hypothetical protein
MKLLADLIDSLIVLLPQHQKHEVLGVGQTDPVEPGLVHPVEGLGD